MIHNNTSYDVAFGRHSLIPECCIEFFIGPWASNDYTQWTAEDRDPGFDGEYVRCDECMRLNKQVKIHKCTKDCKFFI